MRILVLGSDPDYLVNLRGDLIRQIVEQGGQAIGAAPAPADGPHAAAIRAMGAQFESIAMVRNRITPTHDAQALRGLYLLMKRLKPDALFAYTIKPVIYGCTAARMARVPVITALVPGLGYSFEGAGLKDRLRAMVVARMYRGALRTANAVFFQNTDDHQEFLRRGILTPAHRVVMLNGSGINLEKFQPAPLPSAPAFLWVGRLLKEKGLGEYIQAARLVRQRHPEAVFRVVGYHDGGPLDSCQDQLQAAVASGDIEFVGRVKDVRPELARCTAFVLPSYYREGVPRSALEALAMGRAVVTTDWTGCRETVRSGADTNGFLLPVRNAAAVADAVTQLVEQPGLAQRMGAASRRYAEERFDVVRVNQMILDTIGLPRRSAAPAGSATPPGAAEVAR